MTIVSSAEVQKNFGRYKDAASIEPVVVTQYGKPAVVILAATEYERLKELDRRVLRLDDIPDSDLDDMLRSEIPAEYRYSLSDIPN
jgi:prevent-host-death family protein